MSKRIEDNYVSNRIGKNNKIKNDMINKSFRSKFMKNVFDVPDDEEEKKRKERKA